MMESGRQIGRVENKPQAKLRSTLANKLLHDSSFFEVAT